VSAEVLDAEVIEDRQGDGGHELARVSSVDLSVAPEVEPADLVKRLEAIRTTMDDAMVEGVDYGKVPGTDKPALFKPGSEKLGVLFKLDIQPVCEKIWGPGDHLTVEAKATVFDAPTGARLGYGEGLCTTRERKYAYRNAQRVCPSCGASAIIKGKAEYGGGWICFDKKGGCKAKFPDGSDEIESQTVGEIENPDLPDLWNTVIKMAEKRARVDAVLAVTGASALFTQDIEDQAQPSVTPAAEQGPPFGAPASRNQEISARRAIAFLLGLENQDDARVTDSLQAVAASSGDYLPAIVTHGIGHIAKRAKEVHDEMVATQPSENDPASEFTRPLGDGS
jgi:hypothetical protein